MSIVFQPALYGLETIYGAAFGHTSLGQFILKGAAAPTATAAFTFGVTCSLANRAIERVGKEVCTRQHARLGDAGTVFVAMCVVAVKMLSAYKVAEVMEKALGEVVHKNFIHLGNVMWFASVIEYDFDPMVRDLSDGRVWGNVNTQRGAPLLARIGTLIQMIND